MGERAQQNWKEKIHKSYGCAKTDDKIDTQLPVDSLEKNKTKESYVKFI